MIVRIMEDDQYQIDDAHEAAFEQRDQALLATVQGVDPVAFQAALTDLHQFIRANGQKVPYTEILPSDLVVPADDMTLAEAKELMETHSPS